MAEASTTSKRSRRAPGEVRSALLEAARALFAQQGYAGTSTREIAARAAVSEALMFRHFGTKAQLFDVAIIQPFRDFVADYLKTWEAYSSEDVSVEELCGAFVGGLYDLLHDNREIVVALVAAHAYEFDLVDNGGKGVASELSDALSVLERLVLFEIERRSLKGLDPPLTVRVTVGMVMAVAVLDEWLFPGHRPSRRRLVAELTSFMAHGVADRL